MTFQRATFGLLILLGEGLAVASYANWRLFNRIGTVQAFVEGYVLAEAVAACEKTESPTPFKWPGGARNGVIGLNSVKPDKNTIIANFTLVADGVFCDYDPVRKK